MLPFFQYTQFHLGPLTLHVWGLMVALGIFMGVSLMRYRAHKLGLHSQPFEESAFWILLAAFAGARVGHFLFYAKPEDFLSFFRIWEGGWSSMGGILGGMIAASVVYRKKLHMHSEARASDILLLGFPIGMAIGRIGCFLIHDHPGTLSHFVLAVDFPTGARHDLGLYESLLMFALAAVLATQWTKLLKREGMLALVTIASYALLRFPLDFLRVGDARYAGLTAAQYACIGMIFAVLYFRKRWRV